MRKKFLRDENIAKLFATSESLQIHCTSQIKVLHFERLDKLRFISQEREVKKPVDCGEQLVLYTRGHHHQILHT